MNNSNPEFCNYDSYYTNSNFQFSDLTNPGDENTNNQYFNSVTDGFPSTSLQTSVPQVLATSTSTTTHPHNVDLLPFVQIHTTDVQPTTNSFGNIFRRHQSQAEIKSEETIKSEQNDSSGNTANQQNLSNSGTPSTEIPVSTASTVQSNSTLQTIHKCAQCPYITIYTKSLEKHISEVHNTTNQAIHNVQRKKIACPGCDNVFYAKESLEMHLQSDHLMHKEEVHQFLVICSEEVPKKSRIYLKNVEFLREPGRQDQILNLVDNVYCGENNLIDLICDENSDERAQLGKQPAKQKISIKSVDVLREPTLLHREEQSNFDFLPEPNSQSDILCLDNGGISRYTSFIPQPEFNDICALPSNESQSFEKPNRPKIYIKNVDILKEPIILPPANLTNALNVSDDLHFNIFTRDKEFPEKFTEDCINNGFNYNYESNVIDCNNLLVPNTATYTPNIEEQPRSKIYIKNVDILKQPQFQEAPRKGTNFLHLRTVDELNLMNKNEVENLIAPNLEQNIRSTEVVSNTSDPLKTPENTTNFGVLNSDSNVFNKSTDFQTPGSISWSNDYVLDAFDTIIDSNSSSDQKTRHYELNTPQISISDAVDENSDSHDPEILFVCAEELINANQEQDGTIGEISESRQIDRSSLEIVEILDDLERDQRSCDSSQEPIITPGKEGTPIEPVVETQIQSSEQVLIAPEKGRIYIADNLLETEKNTDSQEGGGAIDDDGKLKPRPRGRPFGSNRTGITRLRKLYGNASVLEAGTKCNISGCAFRFKKPEVSEYHRRCHNVEGSRTMICPECKCTNFSNWNTLHTHLWRSHKIDMELHSCELCNFKTPIYSRLVNTHSKIHFEERNYKCDQCEKAFKNSKQLKNHRRWHRTIAVAPPPDVHRCEECGSAFSHLKSLREHLCKSTDLFCCEICGKTLSSKSSLKLHMLTHESAKKFKCNSCDYMANDHNAFRRHRMTHDKRKMYICPLCDYKSIQSVAYQKHIRLKHPESADTIVHKCQFCPFATINGGLLVIHLAKHKLREEYVRSEQLKDNNNLTTVSEPDIELNQEHLNGPAGYLNTADVDTMHPISAFDMDVSKNPTAEPETDNHQPRNKIKVKSDLVLTDPTKFSSSVNSPLLLQSFDNVIR